MTDILFSTLYNETLTQDDMEFCEKIVKEQLSFVSVELASKTFLRSVTNQRINFLGQLSSLGNIVEIYANLKYYVS